MMKDKWLLTRYFILAPLPPSFPPSHPKEKIIRKKREPTLYSLEFFFLTVMNCFFCWFKKERCGTVSMRLLFVFFFQLQCSVHGPRDRL